MKIKCKCGHTIVDSTDDLPHKAHVFGDKDWHIFWNNIDQAIETEGSSKEREARCMELRISDPSQRVWECVRCGRLYFNNSDNDLIEFLPADQKYCGILDR